MNIGTTPKHIFTLPFSAEEEVEAVEITYSQNGKVKLRKTKDDCTITGNDIIVELSQEDTFNFCETDIIVTTDIIVKIQIRVRLKDGQVLASDIITCNCQRCLSHEVL